MFIRTVGQLSVVYNIWKLNLFSYIVHNL